MSTSQRAMMLCGWGVKAGMACLQVKLCVVISERFRKCNWYLKALYECPGSLYFTDDTRIYGFYRPYDAVVLSDIVRQPCAVIRPLSCLSVCPVCPVLTVMLVYCGQTIGRSR